MKVVVAAAVVVVAAAAVEDGVGDIVVAVFFLFSLFPIHLRRKRVSAWKINYLFSPSKRKKRKRPLVSFLRLLCSPRVHARRAGNRSLVSFNHGARGRGLQNDGLCFGGPRHNGESVCMFRVC